MEGHAEMDMSVTEGPLVKRILSANGRTAISHYFVMDWHALWRDIVVGLLLAGALAATVPHSFWQSFFFTSHPLFAKLWGPLVGPLVAILSFVCSIGNVPLAAVLWNGGISFGGVIAFIFADLIVLPVLNIYRKYRRRRTRLSLPCRRLRRGANIDGLIDALGLVPASRSAKIVEAAIAFNYTTVLNVIFLILALLLLIRFFRTGGVEMLRMMDGPDGHHHDHSHLHEHRHH